MGYGSDAAGRRRTAEVRRRQIAGAALEIIAARGLRHFTAREIGRALGLTDAAVFRHLPSKRAIVQAAIDRVEQLLFEGFPPVHTDPVGRLGLFFRRRATVVAGNPGVARLLFSDDLAHAGGPSECARVLEFKRKSAAFVVACLREAHGAGRLTAGIAPRNAALIVMGTLMAFALGRGPEERSSGTREADRLWEDLDRLLFRGCAPSGHRGRGRGRTTRARPAGPTVSHGDRDERIDR